MNERDMRLLWLQECPGVGPALLRRVFSRYGGAPPPGFFGQPATWYRDQFETPLPLAERMAKHLSAVPEVLTGAHALPIRVATISDIDYPSGVKRLREPPPVLLVHGKSEMELTFDNFCVLSSARREWEHADAVKAAIQTGLAAGRRPVAGHNRPVYQWALLAAKRHGARATMVLDRGLLAAFDDDLRRDPVPAARIWGYAFDAENSLAISPFRLRDPWIGANARLRDAIVAALSDVIVAIGVKENGTIHRLCREAAARGQQVYAAPDCLPFLEPAGALPWTGGMPTLAAGASAPAQMG